MVMEFCLGTSPLAGPERTPGNAGETEEIGEHPVETLLGNGKIMGNCWKMFGKWTFIVWKRH